MQRFKRSCWWILGVEGLLATLAGWAFQNSTVAWKLLPILLLALLINLPGAGLARLLGLVGPGGFNPPPDPHPVAGLLLTFSASIVFWIAVAWFLSGCPTRRHAAPAELQPDQKSAGNNRVDEQGGWRPL